MKRILLLLIGLLPLVAWADNVSQQRAKDFATHFLKSSIATRSSAISLEVVYDGLDVSSRGQGSYPPFYVFNNTQGKGFVIVSGDDAATPILGYSVEHNFQGGPMPSNLKFWLDSYASQIEKIRQSGIKSTATVRQEWESMAKATPGHVIRQHETALWGQQAPFNNDCFIVDGQQAVTGCVATATAIIMRFFKWPNQGVGTLPAYTFKNGYREYYVSQRNLNESYDWDNMPLQYNGGESYEQQSQVARLMSDCGVMVKASYGVVETSANPGNISAGLVQYMQYDKSCRFAVRASYPDEQWHSMLQENLQNGPIIYNGSGNRGGHAFILDGYTDKRYYSTNWGWTGYANGYFTLDALVGGDSDFNELQNAILNFKKGDQGGEYVEELRFSEGDNPYGHGLINQPGIDFTQPFNLEVNTMTNMGTKATDFYCKCALVNRYGEEKSVLYNFKMEDMAPGFYFTWNLSNVYLQTPLDPGDRIRIFYHTDRSTEWKVVKGNTENNICWEIIVKEDTEQDSFIRDVNLVYDKETGQFELKGLATGVEVGLTDTQGRDFTHLCKINMGTCTLDTKKMEAGTYVFTLTKSEFGNTESAQLKVVF